MALINTHLLSSYSFRTFLSLTPYHKIINWNQQLTNFLNFITISFFIILFFPSYGIWSFFTLRYFSLVTPPADGANKSINQEKNILFLLTFSKFFFCNGILNSNLAAWANYSMTPSANVASESTSTWSFSFIKNRILFLLYNVKLNFLLSFFLSLDV